MPYELHFQHPTVPGDYAIIVADFVPVVGDTVTIESPDGGKKVFTVSGRSISYYQVESPGSGFVTKIAILVS